MCKLIAVTNRKLCKDDFYHQVECLARAGVDRIVLREKDLSERQYLAMAKEVKNICDAYHIPLFLHQYMYCYAKLQTAGIHLSLKDAMKNRENLKLVSCAGVSVHSFEQIEMAQTSGADYVFFGHVFETACKEGILPRGIQMLEQICKASPLPVYAIGGIDESNVYRVFEAGARGACVMSLGMSSGEGRIRDFVSMCHTYGQ